MKNLEIAKLSILKARSLYKLSEINTLRFCTIGFFRLDYNCMDTGDMTPGMGEIDSRLAAIESNTA